MSKLQYKIHVNALSPTTKTPPTLLSFNNLHMSSLSSALEFLTPLHTLNSPLDPVEKGAVEAYICLLQQLTHTLTYLRYTNRTNAQQITHTIHKNSPLSLPQTLLQRHRQHTHATTHLHALGLLHESRPHILALLKTRVHAIEALLGSDTFLMGTRGPTV
ncbi:hypothetical protein HDU98_005244, partial [Podochytrium sp. JEL0797]